MGDRLVWSVEFRLILGPLDRHFYRYEPPRPLEVIEADIKTLEQEIMSRLADVTGSNGVTP